MVEVIFATPGLPLDKKFTIEQKTAPTVNKNAPNITIYNNLSLSIQNKNMSDPNKSLELSPERANTAEIEGSKPGLSKVRSYVRRQGKITAGQRRAIAEEAHHWLIPFEGEPLELAAIFQNDHPVVLEIGFGMGETTQAIAEQKPEVNFLGIEVYTAGVGSLVNRITQKGLTNIRIIQHDAVEVLEQSIEASSLDAVHIFFPDPWQKKRHHKRRLIQSDFVDLLASRLKPGGILHCATDWRPYAEQMLEVLSGCALLSNTTDGYSPRPSYRPLTKFELRGLALGHEVVDLVFSRQAPSPPSQTAS
jgi:tRNA (guanine-N7-)-methyltransferase